MKRTGSSSKMKREREEQAVREAAMGLLPTTGVVKQSATIGYKVADQKVVAKPKVQLGGGMDIMR